MTRITKKCALPVLLIALGGAIGLALPTTDALAQSAGVAALSPSRPTVPTVVEPGIVKTEEINREVKDATKRKQLADQDRKKYGVGANLLANRGHGKKLGNSLGQAK